MNVLVKAKRFVAEVEPVYTAATGALAASVPVLVTVVGSRTLATVVAAAALTAAVAGFAITVSVYRGQPKEICMKRRVYYILVAFGGLLLAIATLTVVDPDIAKMSSVAAAIREFLFSAMLTLNAVVGLAAFTFVFSATAAMVLSSKTLWRGGRRG